jgi:transposase InsO family protein
LNRKQLDAINYLHAENETLQDAGVDVIRTRVATPEQNGYAERFVKSLKTECLDRMILFGEKSLRNSIENYVIHYHHERLRSAALATNHQSLDNLIPFPYVPRNAGKSGSVVKI